MRLWIRLYLCFSFLFQLGCCGCQGDENEGFKTGRRGKCEVHIQPHQSLLFHFSPSFLFVSVYLASNRSFRGALSPLAASISSLPEMLFAARRGARSTNRRKLDALPFFFFFFPLFLFPPPLLPKGHQISLSPFPLFVPPFSLSLSSASPRSKRKKEGRGREWSWSELFFRSPPSIPLEHISSSSERKVEITWTRIAEV